MKLTKAELRELEILQDGTVWTDPPSRRHKLLVRMSEKGLIERDKKYGNAFSLLEADLADLEPLTSKQLRGIQEFSAGGFIKLFVDSWQDFKQKQKADKVLSADVIE